MGGSCLDPHLCALRKTGCQSRAVSHSAQELVSRYGHFSIFLYASARDTRQSLRGSAPDKQGIYWTHEVVERGPYAGESQWIAEKFYPENIVSAWNGKGPKLDGRWTRLDELLNKIVGEKDA